MSGIPTLRGGGAAGTQLFNQLLQQQGGAGVRPNAFMTRRGFDPRTAGSATSLMRLRPPMPQIGLRGIRDITAPTGGGGMTRLQSDLAAKMGLGAQTPKTPKAPQSLMDRLTPAVGTPAFAGLSEAAATGLQLSGYQDKPITTGQGLGAMFGAGMKAYNEAKRADLADRIAMAKLSQKSDFETKLALAGIDTSTAEGQAQARKILMKSGSTTIDLGKGDTEREKQRAKMDYGKLGKLGEKVQGMRELEPRINIIQDLALGGIDTGALTSATMGARNLLASAGFLTEEQARDLSDQQVFQAQVSFLVPRMRVAGTGASSDKDMAFFQEAVPSLRNNPRANLIIAGMYKQVMANNAAEYDLMYNYLEENDSLRGFNKFRSENLRPTYLKVATDDEFDSLVADGSLKLGDVFYDKSAGSFDILTQDLLPSN
jgi:hypothetical protein